jgi:hypothetical protein
MKSLILISGLILFSGCSVSISDAYVVKAKELCMNNEGIKYISGSTLLGSAAMDINVDCKNGAHFYIGKIK